MTQTPERVMPRMACSRTLHILVEEVHKIKKAPFIAPRESAVGSVDMLQTELLFVADESLEREQLDRIIPSHV